MSLPGETGSPRLYGDLAAWWPLLSPPEEYETEADDLLRRLNAISGSRSPTSRPRCSP